LVPPPGVSSQDKTDLFSYAEYEEQLHKENEQYERSAFDGTFSRIAVIVVLAFSDAMRPQGAMAWYGENKAELLRQFWERMGQLCPSLFITHNGLGFDSPFLKKKRSIIHQVKPPFEINLAKFRTEPVYDTMAIWSNWDMRGWVKLDVLAKALNVETKSGSGAQVAEMWANRKKKDVAEYCLQGTFVTYGCYSRMVFQKHHSREDVLRMPQYLHVD
jgi:DNA polymerase elongation subunit (family B)